MVGGNPLEDFEQDGFPPRHTQLFHLAWSRRTGDDTKYRSVGVERFDAKRVDSTMLLLACLDQAHALFKLHHPKRS